MLNDMGRTGYIQASCTPGQVADKHSATCSFRQLTQSFLDQPSVGRTVWYRAPQVVTRCLLMRPQYQHSLAL